MNNKNSMDMRNQHFETLPAAITLTIENPLPRKGLSCVEKDSDISTCEFELIYENAPIGCFVINAEKKIIKFNREAENIFGYSSEEMLGKNLTALIPERYKNFHNKAFGGVMGQSENKSKTYEFIAQRKNGDEFPAELSFSLIKECKHPFMVVTIRDISHRKGLETEMKERTDVLQDYLKLHNQWLVETEQKYNVLFTASKTGLFYLKEDATVLNLNTVAEEILGTDKSTIIGTPVTGIMPEREQHRAHEIVKKIFRDIINYKAEKVMEGFVVNSQGREVPVEFCFKKIENGADGSIVCMVKDMSTVKQIENQLIKSQKFEGLGLLIGGMVHNFKNIMASIMGYASLMKTMVAGDEKLCRYLNIIETSCARASDLSREVLTIGRKQDAERKVLNMNTVAERSIVLFEQCIDRRFAINKDLAPALNKCELNESQIEQVLLNLLLNARDAMSDGGEIYVSTQNIYINQEACKDYQNVTGGSFVEILVKDSGMGISHDVQTKIFDPFFTTKEEGKGTGLGLSTVDRIVKNHRGFIRVFSKEGEGATFRIYLPSVENAVDDAQDKEKSRNPRKGLETILAVDDENKVIRMISDYLGGLGYNILSASDGREAVELFTENKNNIDLIILDLVMPSMNGYEAFKEIKAIDPSTKIILCTGHAADDSIQEMLGSGVNGLLKKPYRVEDLSRAIRLVLDEQAAGVSQYQQ